MQTQVVRFVLSAILLAAGCGAVLWSWRLVQQVEQLQRAANLTFERIDRLQGLLDELGDRQLTFVGSDRENGRAIEAALNLLHQVIAESSTLAAESLAKRTPAARAVANAAGTIASIDTRARENLGAGLDLMSADLTFTETQSARHTLRQEVRILRTAEADTVADARLVALKQALAALAGVALLFALALVQWSRIPAGSPPLVSSPIPHSPEGEDGRPEAGSARAVDLASAADVCTALGRLKNETDLQGILQQVASLLDASGVVVWMGAGEDLFPAASVGYHPRDLNRLGPIPRAAVNATATAWRTGVLQTVTADSASRAAVVAPMLGPDRCIGVLALEVAPGREADASTRAVTALIAAQLAAVLAAWPAGADRHPDVQPLERAVTAST